MLADVVVQVSRDSRPLDFLRPDQAAGQMPKFLMVCLQCRLARANPIFGVLPFGDVDVAADIAGEIAISSVLRDPRSQKPSVLAVGVAQSILQEEGFPRLERRRVGVQGPLDVLGMHKVQPAVLSQLFERPTRQLLAEAVQIVERRVRPGGPDQDGCLIGPQTKLLDAFTQRSSLDEQAGYRRHENRKRTQKGCDDRIHNPLILPALP